MERKTVKISEIKRNPSNPRIIKDGKFEKLVNSIKGFPKMLEIRPIVVNEEMIVLGGNMRLKACKEAGLKQVPIEIFTQLDADEMNLQLESDGIKPKTYEDFCREFIIKDNVGFGEWEWDMLANEWDAKDLNDWGLDIEFKVEEAEAEEDDYEVPDEIQTNIVLGDLIEIGEHRLLCGDSSDSELLFKLTEKKTIDLLLTDPPYGIDYGNQLIKGEEFKEKTNKHGWRNFGNPEWDKTKPESGVLQYLCEITDNQIIWGGNYFTDDLPPTMGWLIWDKGQRGFSLADGEMAWTSFSNALRIKEYARAKANQEEKFHATQKPIEIINWCFEYADRHSKKEPKIILDAFLGSGSTMVASHQLNRKCYGMELDPKYCQVIIDRMLNLEPLIDVKINGKEYYNHAINK